MTIAILLFDDVEVLDFAGPFEVFSVASNLIEEGQIRLVTVAESTDEVRAIGGLRVRPECTIAEIAAPEVLVVPGGDGTRREMDNGNLVQWVADVHESARLVLSVCSGARLLCHGGAP